ncbi:hypothetical protein AB9P05_04200 [Roseivirga sp. BDSF3-8]|uniref:hypothetical protein n=1 Tax=Roseivirga sp. BDSF3-8 TaxID=3241598 RepID=UPI0035318992
MRKSIPRVVASILLIFSFSACDKESLNEHPENLQGDFEVLYFVERAGDSLVIHQDPDPELPILIHFGVAGLIADTLMVKYQSQARPNSLWGDLKVYDRNSFHMGDVSATRQLPTQWERLFHHALSQGQSFKMEDDRLLIMYGNPESMVVLGPAKK